MSTPTATVADEEIEQAPTAPAAKKTTRKPAAKPAAKKAAKPAATKAKTKAADEDAEETEVPADAEEEETADSEETTEETAEDSDETTEEAATDEVADDTPIEKDAPLPTGALVLSMSDEDEIPVYSTAITGATADPVKDYLK